MQKTKNKPFKPSSVPIAVMIIIAILTLAFVLVSGVYLWYFTKIVDPIQQLAQSQQALQQEVQEIKGKTVATKDVVVAEDAAEDIDGKKFEGEDFSFVYPEEYIADDKGIWTKEGYDRHINPPAYCDTCQIPLIEIKSEFTSISLEKYILANFQLPGNTLEEMSAQTNIPYSTIELGDNEFIKIAVKEFFDVTGYYTKKGRNIVAFRVYAGVRDNAELREIISSFKFD